jgi:hypothetical protein
MLSEELRHCVTTAPPSTAKRIAKVKPFDSIAHVSSSLYDTPSYTVTRAAYVGIRNTKHRDDLRHSPRRLVPSLYVSVVITIQL